MLNIQVIHYEEITAPNSNQIAKVTVLIQDWKVVLSGIRMYENTKRKWMHLPAMKVNTHNSSTYYPNFYFADEEEDKVFQKHLFDTIVAYRDGEVRDVG